MTTSTTKPASHVEYYESRAVPPAPPPSPVLPPENQLNPVFIPAAIMTTDNHILPEKVLTTTGEPAVHLPSHIPTRHSLLEGTPHAILPAPAPPIVGQAHSGPAGRPLIRRSSAHVFEDLTKAVTVETQWEIKPLLESTIATGQESLEAPLLPAPLDTMLRSGEGYIIKDAQSGQVISRHMEPVFPPKNTIHRHQHLEERL